jgi:DNA adenine methylase
MMTYDDAESVRVMAERRAFTITKVPMKNTHHAEMCELLITPF